MIRKSKITVTLTGATGSQQSTAPLNGKVQAVHIAYTGQTGGTCDVTITAVDPDLNVLVVSNNDTSGWYFPRAEAQDTAGAALVFAATDPVPVEIPVDGYVTVSVAGAAAGSVVVTLLLEQ